MPDGLARATGYGIYKEIASQAFYTVGQSLTQDAGAKALMKELAEEETKHLQWLKYLKERGLEKRGWHKKEVPNLGISDYLTGSDTLEGAGLQDVLVFAIKRDQQAIEFYSKMIGIMRDRCARRLCQRLVHSELKHKLSLAIFYDDLFYGGD